MTDPKPIKKVAGDEKIRVQRETLRLKVKEGPNLFSRFEQHNKDREAGVEPAPAQICRPGCPICGGSGYYRKAIENYNDPDFGKLFPCPNQGNARLLQRASRYGLTSNELEKLEWSDIKSITENNAASAAKQVQTILERGWGFVYLYGNYGTGKTEILKIATATYLRDGKQAVYVEAVTLLDDLRNSFAKSSTDDLETRLEFWMNLPLLCLDELNFVNETPWVKERTRQILNTLYERACKRHEGIVIITSNIDPDKQDGYLLDRLSDGRADVIPVVGTSARPEQIP